MWSSSNSEEDADMPCASTSSYGQPIWVLIFFLLLWQAVYHISNAALVNMLAFVRYFTLLLGNAFQCRPLQKMVEGTYTSFICQSPQSLSIVR